MQTAVAVEAALMAAEFLADLGRLNLTPSRKGAKRQPNYFVESRMDLSFGSRYKSFASQSTAIPGQPRNGAFVEQLRPSPTQVSRFEESAEYH
jgi:hypothetical protein